MRMLFLPVDNGSLPLEFDPPSASTGRPFGSERVMTALDRAFGQTNRVQLVGPTGVGKAEIALDYARRWTKTLGGQGPVFWFDFSHPVPLAQICDRVAHFLGEPLPDDTGDSGRALDAVCRRESAIRWLRQTPVVMIWRNFHLSIRPSDPDVYPNPLTTDSGEWRDFLRALEGGKTRLLLTTTQVEPGPDPVGEVLLVPEIDAAGAQELAELILLDNGMDKDHLRSLPPFPHLLEMLFRNPQALELVLPDLPGLGPDTIASKWRRLAGHEQSHRACLTALQYRWEGLEPLLRQRLSLLGLFRGCVSARLLTVISIGEEVPAAWRDLGRDDWGRLLNVMAEMKLLQKVGEATYSMSVAVQSMLELWLRNNFTEPIDWLERKFCAVCGRAGNQLSQISQANPGLAMAILPLEQHNLVRALQLAWRRQDEENCTEILRGLKVLYLQQRRITEWNHLRHQLKTRL